VKAYSHDVADRVGGRLEGWYGCSAANELMSAGVRPQSAEDQLNVGAGLRIRVMGVWGDKGPECNGRLQQES